MEITRIHHVAIICSDYQKSKYFYHHILGFKIIAENYREDKQSYKLDLACNDGTQIELFSFKNTLERLTFPKARGLRHLALTVTDINKAIDKLKQHNIESESVRIDEYTGSKYTFFRDPDNLPLELYECKKG